MSYVPLQPACTCLGGGAAVEPEEVGAEKKDWIEFMDRCVNNAQGKWQVTRKSSLRDHKIRTARGVACLEGGRNVLSFPLGKHMSCLGVCSVQSGKRTDRHLWKHYFPASFGMQTVTNKYFLAFIPVFIYFHWLLSLGIRGRYFLKKSKNYMQLFNSTTP